MESFTKFAGLDGLVALVVLVNNAGNDDRHEMEEITPEYWRERLASNLDH
jgi:D-xylose 1-dehydrogenase